MFWWWEKGHCVIVEQIEHPSEVWNYLYQTQINLNTDRNFPKSLTLNLPVHSHNPTHPYQADIMLSVTHTYNVILLTLHTKITQWKPGQEVKCQGQWAAVSSSCSHWFSLDVVESSQPEKGDASLHSLWWWSSHLKWKTLSASTLFPMSQSLLGKVCWHTHNPELVNL